MRNSVNETINNRERKREYRNSITYSESYPQYVKFTECVTSCQHFRERERKENKKKNSAITITKLTNSCWASRTAGVNRKCENKNTIKTKYEMH